MAEVLRDEWFLVANDDKLSIKIKEQVTLGEDQLGHLTLESRHESERWITLSIDPEGELIVSELHQDCQIERPGGWTSREPGVVLQPGMCLALGDHQVCLSQSLSREQLTQELLVVTAGDLIKEPATRPEPPLQKSADVSVSDTTDLLRAVPAMPEPNAAWVEQPEIQPSPSTVETGSSEETDPLSLAVNGLDVPVLNESDIAADTADTADTADVTDVADDRGITDTGDTAQVDAPVASGLARAQHQRGFAPKAMAVSIALANRDLVKARVQQRVLEGAPSTLEAEASDNIPQESADAGLAFERIDDEGPSAITTGKQSGAGSGDFKVASAVQGDGAVTAPRRGFSARTALAASIALTMAGYWAVNEQASPGKLSQQQSTVAPAQVTAISDAALGVPTRSVDGKTPPGSVSVAMNEVSPGTVGLQVEAQQVTQRIVQTLRDVPASLGTPGRSTRPTTPSSRQNAADSLPVGAQDVKPLASVSRIETFSQVVIEAENLIAQGFINWPERNAVSILGDLLAADPDHPQAVALLNEATSRYLKEAEKAHADGFHQAAIDMLQQANRFHPAYEDIDRLRTLWGLN